MAFFPMDVIDEGLALRGQISEISLRVEPGRLGDVQRAVGSLIASRSELAVYTWEESAAEFLAIGESKRGFQLILLLLIALIALVGVVNTVLLASLERTREIGMLKALGMGEGEIIKTFVFESLGIGLLGSLLGCLLAVLVNLYMTHIGVDFTPFFGDLDIGYPVQGRVFGIWNWPLFVTAFSFGVVVSALAGVLPALGAAKKDPIWALRQ
ncbi:MAG: ABC transporter permease, partial [Limnochordia bacterium]|jgi:putative ABC transport system permease protein